MPQTHLRKLPDIRPSADFCLGRESLCAEVEEGATQNRSALLFGGRQSGKTSLLLKLQQQVNQQFKNAGQQNNSYLAIYVNLLELQPDASPAAFFRKLAKQTLETCRGCIDNFSLKKLPSNAKPTDSSPDLFAADLKEIFAASSDVYVRPIFLLDESKRILGNRFPRGFQDNLFALLYGSELGLGGRISIIFSGAQEIYQFCIDDTSPIGSRASKHIITNLDKNAVAAIVRQTSIFIPIKNQKFISEWLYDLTGGHAGLTVGLLRRIARCGTIDEVSLGKVHATFLKHHSEILNLWFASLSREARCIHDFLAKNSEITLPQIVRCLSNDGLDRFKADRAREQLQFTGIGHWEKNILYRTNKLYWDFAHDFLHGEAGLEASDNVAGKARELIGGASSTRAISVAFSYSHKDEKLRDQLETHLRLLQRNGIIKTWHDRKIMPGDKWVGVIDENFKRADLILLLVSADFLASDYCYEIEMKNALDREAKGEARVVPIILHECLWKKALFGKLQALPKDGKPVSNWGKRDQAWINVAEGIVKIVEESRSRGG